jgi:cytochrome b subunit of formate dehydrogenase
MKMKLLFILILLVNISTNISVFASTNSTSDPFEWLKNLFDKGVSTVQDLGSYLLHQAIKLLLFLARIVYIVVALIGVILWFSGLQPYKGKRYTIGAGILAIAVEILNMVL